jgi:CubicO group peptidase (beta-lactamase class C family)
MRARSALLVLLCSVFWGGLPLIGEVPSKQDAFDDYIRAYVRNGDFSGSVLVSRAGRVVFRKSYGMANYELSVPNTEKTRFHIASVSKTFTAAAIVLLEKQGRLKLSDPLSKWIPDFLNGEKITVEQMLTHRSGLPDYYSLPEYSAKRSQRVTLPDLIAWVKTKPLDFLPGSESRYSNTGYAFLAYIVEQTSGKRYEDFVAEQLFQPAGMKESGTFRDDELIMDRASGYQPWVGAKGMRNAPAYDKTILTGAGSLYSTTGDLHAWCRALLEKKFFDLNQLAYPYGWGEHQAAGPNGKKRKLLEQDGRDPGFVSHVSIYPDDDLIVLVLGNLEDGAVNPMAAGLAAIALGENATAPPARVQTKSLQPGDEYFGRYEVRPDFLIDVKQVGADLFLRGTGGDYLPLEPTGKDSFFYRQFYLTVRFQRNKAGKVDQLLWQGDYPCKKVAEKPQE